MHDITIFRYVVGHNTSECCVLRNKQITRGEKMVKKVVKKCFLTACKRNKQFFLTVNDVVDTVLGIGFVFR